MVVFKFEVQDANARALYWLDYISCNGEDAIHTDEIYEQLDAASVFNV
jgi:hypothetical protein